MENDEIKRIIEEIEKRKNKDKNIEIEKKLKQQTTKKTEEKEDFEIERENKEQEKGKVTKVTTPFLTEEKPILFGLMKKKTPITELKEGVVLLAREDGYIDILQGVKSGKLRIKAQNGEYKSILLPDGMKKKLRYAGNSYNCWMAYENCAIALPEDPILEAEMLEKIVSKVVMNVKDVNEIKGMEIRKDIIKYVIIGLVIIMALLFGTGAGQGLISGFIDGILKGGATTAITTGV